LAAWEDFAERVREYILRERPEVKKEPGWGEWLDGKVVIAWREAESHGEFFPFWRKWFDENPHAFDRIDTVEN
jgi:hypothetical protein